MENNNRAYFTRDSNDPLQNEVHCKRDSLKVYQAYAKNLLAENMSIISSIIETEERTVRYIVCYWYQQL